MSSVVKSLEDVKHLTVKAKTALKLSDEERISYIRAPRWIGYSKANESIDKLEDLLTYPKRHRMPNLLLVGDTNNGKTAIINKFAKRHPHDDNRSGESVIVPVLIVETRPVPDETSLYNSILKR